MILHKIQNNQSGITIIEVVAVVMIVSIGFISILALVQQNLRVQNINKNSIVASQLAQEGLETVRNIRERNWQLKVSSVPSRNFYDGIVISTCAPQAYRTPLAMNINKTDPKLNCLTSADFPLDSRLFFCTKPASLGLMGHNYAQGCGTSPSVGPETMFRRMITTEYDSGAGKVKVTCEVKWTERGNTRIYSATEELYDWF